MDQNVHVCRHMAWGVQSSPIDCVRTFSHGSTIWTMAFEHPLARFLEMLRSLDQARGGCPPLSRLASASAVRPR